MLNMYQNKVPIYEMISGASLAFAALLLIIPGFFTDLVGFLLLIPLSRKVLFKILFKKKDKINLKTENEIIDGEIVEKDKDET
jgi:UPF0716 protein FxsA